MRTPVKQFFYKKNEGVNPQLYEKRWIVIIESFR